jgi:hypothetical protein
MLVEKPDDFVRMRNEIGRKFESDQPIHRHSVDLIQIQKTAGEHLTGNAFRDRVVEWHRDDFRIMAFGHETFLQFHGMQFRAAQNKRSLHRRDGYSHGKLSAARLCSSNIMKAVIHCGPTWMKRFRHVLDHKRLYM